MTNVLTTVTANLSDARADNRGPLDCATIISALMSTLDASVIAALDTLAKAFSSSLTTIQ